MELKRHSQFDTLEGSPPDDTMTGSNVGAKKTNLHNILSFPNTPDRQKIYKTASGLSELKARKGFTHDPKQETVLLDEMASLTHKLGDPKLILNIINDILKDVDPREVDNPPRILTPQERDLLVLRQVLEYKIKMREIGTNDLRKVYREAEGVLEEVIG